MNSLKTPKPLLAARMAFPLAASLITMLLGEWIARGALTADTVTSFIFPHAEAYLLAWLFLFLIWLLLDWIFWLPPRPRLRRPPMPLLQRSPSAVAAARARWTSRRRPSLWPLRPRARLSRPTVPPARLRPRSLT